MFRECYFEYAGESSEPYNLMLCYVGSGSTAFDSGGKFELKTDARPYSHESLLYGKDYSAQPLEFEVEFINIDGYIPLQQMIEIKNWLFGQDGWKVFRCLDERQDYYLKCIFEPIEDIAGAAGYRGLRCKLRNNSPFWHSNPIKMVITNEDIANAPSNGSYQGSKQISIEMPQIGDADRVFPILDITVNASQYLASGNPSVIIYNITKEPLSELAFNDLSTAVQDDKYSVNTRFRWIYSERLDAYSTNATEHKFIEFYTGSNTLIIMKSDTITVDITITFEYPVRIGAF